MRKWRAWAVVAAFALETSGTVFILAALSFPAMIGSIGLAIDFSCYLSGRRHFDDAVEAAALAAARRRIEVLLDAQQAALSEDARDDVTRTYAVNFVSQLTSTLSYYRISTVADPVVEIARDNGRVIITATAAFSPLFGSIFSSEPLPMIARAAAEIEPRDIEMAIAIDVGAGMGRSWGGGPKIDELKDQLQLFMTAVKESSSVKQRQFALIPYAGGVNAGSYTATVTNGTASGASTCVFERAASSNQPYDDQPLMSPLVPASAAPPSLSSCPDSVVWPLTDLDESMFGAVQALSTSGGTAGHLGVAWAYYTLSSKWSGVWPGNAAASDSHKVAFLIAGGAFDTWRDEPPAGRPNRNLMQSNAVARTIDTCVQMKNAGITVVTLLFATQVEIDDELTKGANTYQAMQDCASGSAQAYVARDSYELTMALRNISSALVSARLVE